MLIGVITIVYQRSWIEEARRLDLRIALVRRAVDAETGLACVLCPAGTLVVNDSGAATPAAERLIDGLRGVPAAIVWGVDVRGDDNNLVSPRRKGHGLANTWDAAKNPFMSCYGYVALPDGSRPIWHCRQLAYRSTQAVHCERLPRNRVFSLSGSRVGMLLCGEMMARVFGSGRSMERVHDIVCQSEVGLVAAHADVALRGFVRWTTAIQRLADEGEHGRSVLVAQHISADAVARRLPKYTNNGAIPMITSTGTRHVRRSEIGAGSAVPEAVIDVYEVDRRQPNTA